MISRELYETEKSKQRKLEDCLIDRETTLKIKESDMHARKTDLLQLYASIQTS